MGGLHSISLLVCACCAAAMMMTLLRSGDGMEGDGPVLLTSEAKNRREGGGGGLAGIRARISRLEREEKESKAVQAAAAAAIKAGGGANGAALSSAKVAKANEKNQGGAVAPAAAVVVAAADQKTKHKAGVLTKAESNPGVVEFRGRNGDAVDTGYLSKQGEDESWRVAQPLDRYHSRSSFLPSLLFSSLLFSPPPSHLSPSPHTPNAPLTRPPSNRFGQEVNNKQHGKHARYMYAYEYPGHNGKGEPTWQFAPTDNSWLLHPSREASVAKGHPSQVLAEKMSRDVVEGDGGEGERMKEGGVEAVGVSSRRSRDVVGGGGAVNRRTHGSDGVVSFEAAAASKHRFAAPAAPADGRDGVLSRWKNPQP